MNICLDKYINKIIKSLLLIFMITLPLHYLLFTILLKNISFLKIWKEILVIIMSILLFIKKYNSRYHNNDFKIPDILNCVLLFFIFISFIYFLTSPKISASINILRIYLIPLILYYIVKNISFKKYELENMYKIISIESIILSIYAIFQSLFLGHKFLISLGYPVRPNGRLATSFYLSGLGNFQRAVGTFVSSNTFAFFISIVFLVSLYVFFRNTRLKKLSFITIIFSLLGLFFTFSRSCLLACFISAIFIIITNSNKESLKKIFIYCLIGLFFVLIFICVLSMLTNNNYFQLILNYFINSVQFKDTSILSHLNSYSESFEVFLNNIWGTGLGKNGPKAVNYFNETYITESSFFLIMFEFGIVGFVTYYLLYLIPLYEYFSKKNHTNFACYIIVFALIAFCFLPYVQDLEIISYIFILLGLQHSINNSNKEKKHRILFLHSSAELYGSDNSLYNLIYGFNNKEIIEKMFIILPCDGPLVNKIKKIKSDKIQISLHSIGVLRRKNLSTKGIIFYILEYLFSVLYLIMFIYRNDINLVYTNTSVVMSGGIATKLLGIKNIWHIRETLDKSSMINRIIMIYIYILSDDIIANSNATLNSFLLKSRECTYVVYNAVSPIEKKLGSYHYDGIDFTIGMAGRINSWKGQMLFINACNLLKKRFSHLNIKFLIAGDAYSGDYYLVEMLKDRINELNMNDEIVLLGQVNDMADFYNSIDLFVLPSIKPEPFGLVVIEAMSLGLPVIASNQGGPVEIINHGENGLLFTNKSEEDLCEKMSLMITNNKFYSQISEQAKITQKEKFSVEQYCNNIFKIIEGEC